MVTKKIASVLTLLTFLLTLFPAPALGAVREDYNLAAEFNITSREMTEHIEAFTFTSSDSISGSTSPVTNQLISGGGFEPAVFRNKFSVTDCTDNELLVSRSLMSDYDTYTDGLLEGGTAYVYRAVDGKIELVRVSEIERYSLKGGWKIGTQYVLTTTYANVGFDAWNRDGNYYYYAIAAVDNDGNESPTSNWVTLTKTSAHANKNANESSNAYIKKDITGIPSESLTAAPASLTAEDKTTHYTLNWEPVDGAAGYVIYMSYYPEEEHEGFFARLSKIDTVTGLAAEPLKINDFVIVSKNFYEWSRDTHLSPRVYDAGAGRSYPIFRPVNNEELYDWRLVKHEDNPPFSNAGDSYMEIKPKGPGLLTNMTAARIGLGNLSDGGRGNGANAHWYRDLTLGSTIVVEFWAKSTNPGDRIVFDIEGGPWETKWWNQDLFNVQHLNMNYPTNGGPIYLNVSLTDQWTKYTLEYEVKDRPASPWVSVSRLNIFGDGTISVDAFQMYDKSTPPDQWPKSVVQDALNSGFSYNRIHSFIKTGNHTYDMAMLCNPAGAFNKSAAGSATLDAFLNNTRNAKMNPWFQIEFHMSPDEWLGWMDYMCQEYDPLTDTPQAKPYAYKRYAAGQTTPWVDEFDGIYFEVANETWNDMFLPWNFSPMVDEVTHYEYNASEVYGLFHEFIINTLKTSPYWYKMEPKFKSVLGGWTVNEHEMHAAKWTKSADFLTRAEYNGGWDDGGTILTDDKNGYFHTSVFAIQQAKPAGENFTRAARKFNEERPLGSYEAGPGYPLPGSSLSEEEQLLHDQANNVQKSLTGAVSTLDAFLINAAYYNHATQNYFTFSSGNNYWKSHAELKDGGQEHVVFRALSMYSNYTTGRFLQVDEVSAPKYDIEPVYKSNGKLSRYGADDAPMVGAYATFDGNKYSVYVISRKIPSYPYEDDEGYTPVILNMPFDKVYKINMRKMTGNYDDNNIYSDNVKIQEQSIPADKFSKRFVLNEETGAEADGIPPCSVYQYDFYLKYDDLQEQPDLTVTKQGNDITLSWEDVASTKYFVYSSDEVDGIYKMVGSTFGDELSYTIENADKKYFYVRAFNKVGYRDSLVMSEDNEAMTSPDLEPTEEIDIDPPPFKAEVDLLLWDNFTYIDETEVADEVPLEPIVTGLAVSGWKELNRSNRVGWLANPAADRVFNANINPQREFLTYGNLETSGLYASVMGIGVNADEKPNWIVGREIETKATGGKTLVLEDYIGTVKGARGGTLHNVGGLNNKTLWHSTLIRSSNDNLEGVVANYGLHSDNAVGKIQLLIGYSEQTKKNGQYYWGIKYATKEDGNINDGNTIQTEYVVTDLPVTKDETVLVVIKFYFELGKDKATVWLNPDKGSLGGENPTGGAKIHLDGGADFKNTGHTTKINDNDGITIEFDPSVRLRTNVVGIVNSSQALDFHFSDIRFGRTYKSVTPTMTEGIRIINGKITDVCFRPDGVNENAKIILGVYDNKKFEEAHIFGRPISLSSEWLVNLSLRSFNVMMPEGKNVRMFVWDDLKTMKPLTEEVFEAY